MLPLVPLPATVETTSEDELALSEETLVAVLGSAPEARRVAEDLASALRAATGLELPLADGPRPGAIVLDGSGPAALGTEGYELEIGPDGARLTAAGAEGLFRGAQTLRQLVAAAPGEGPVSLPAVRIADAPRFAYRGTMLDVSRHFFGVADVKRYIDLIALYKVNYLHLHLSDDQGWRIEIEGWPRLTEHGASTAVGGGEGGFYTQADYAEIVRHAGTRFVTIVPEIDTPGHVNAALASYPELTPDGVAPALYTETSVGFSSLTVASERTYEFLDDVFGQLAGLTPGPFLHVGGDEAQSTSGEDYRTFIGRVQALVRAHGKRMSGWEEIAAAPLEPGALVQLWGDQHSSETYADLASMALARGAKLLMSPGERTYLDMKYEPDFPLGQDWAGLIDVRDAYDWDPGTLVPGVAEEDVVGVEAPLWTETIETLDHITTMAFPRLPAIAEVGWSPQAARSWEDFRARLAAHGPRWKAMGVAFHPSPQVDWVDY